MEIAPSTGSCFCPALPSVKTWHACQDLARKFASAIRSTNVQLLNNPKKVALAFCDGIASCCLQRTTAQPNKGCHLHPSGKALCAAGVCTFDLAAGTFLGTARCVLTSLGHPCAALALDMLLQTKEVEGARSHRCLHPA